MPPDAENVKLYACPFIAKGRVDADVIANTAIEKVLVAVAEAASVTWTVKSNDPKADGTPDIRPPGLMPSPGGRVPEMTDHVYG